MVHGVIDEVAYPVALNANRVYQHWLADPPPDELSAVPRRGRLRPRCRMNRTALTWQSRPDDLAPTILAPPRTTRHRRPGHPGPDDPTGDDSDNPSSMIRSRI